jgi:hypothetical protein
LLHATNAFASGTARVVLVSHEAAELALRLRAEAEHVGISVASERGSGSFTDAELVRRHGAVGVVEIVSLDRVRIHVAGTGEHGAYDAVVERALADGDGFPVRVVEQMRGRLVELRILAPEPEAAAREPAPSAKPEPALDANARPAGDRPDAAGRSSAHSPTLGLAVGGAVASAAGGLGPTPGVSLGLRLEPAARWAATLRGLLPVAENDLEQEPEGEASVRVSLFFAELGYRLAPHARFAPEIGAGAGLVVLPLEAEAEEPREAHDDNVVAGVYFLHAGAGFSATSWLRFRAAMRAGVSAPRPVLRFSGREVATWGRGFFAGTLDAEFQLPLSGGEGAP